jgi:CRP/FNR family cyclic AMP-dependent transcriptional regulator
VDEQHALEILSQLPLGGAAEVHRKLIEVGKIVSFAQGETIIQSGAHDRTIYFILQGSVDVQVNGTKRVKHRKPLQVLGEMTLLQPYEPRSATCVAEGDVVLLAIEPAAFAKVADEFPSVWRALACSLSDKVREYTVRVRLANIVPKVFIGSSSEALPVATEVKNALAGAEVVLWPEAFTPGSFTLEALLKQVQDADFAAFVLAPDDIGTVKGRRHSMTRDNVIFELGLFMGVLSRARTFALSEQTKKLRILTDLDGVTRLTYRWDRSRPLADGFGVPALDVASAVAAIGRAIIDLGPR